jgi:hypothetical protein
VYLEVGDNNMAIGYGAGSLEQNESNNIDIGSPGVVGDEGVTHIIGIVEQTVAGSPVCVTTDEQLAACATKPATQTVQIRALTAQVAALTGRLDALEARKR